MISIVAVLIIQIYFPTYALHLLVHNSLKTHIATAKVGYNQSQMKSSSRKLGKHGKLNMDRFLLQKSTDTFWGLLLMALNIANRGRLGATN